jgi:nitrate reductase gamma subunit
MNLSNLLFGVYPYIALTTFFVGSLIHQISDKLDIVNFPQSYQIH